MAVNDQYILPNSDPTVLPGLLAWWWFKEGGTRFTTHSGHELSLFSQTQPLEFRHDEKIPGGHALLLKEGDWLSIPRAECPMLDFHGTEHPFTLVVWLSRHQRKVYPRDCEFIAGQWNETDCGRQYGLFLDIGVWQKRDTVFGHISSTGGPTSGYRYCMDGAQGATEIQLEQWHCIGMSYDGKQVYAWLDGEVDLVPGLNPYPFADGVHHAGSTGSDFTVGAVDRGGQIGNFFTGEIAGIAIYDRSLSPAEHALLSRWGL